MNKPRPIILARSAVLQQLFTIQDGKRMSNSELGARAGLSPDRISNLRRALFQKSSIEQAEMIATALGYEIVLVPVTHMPQTALPVKAKKPPSLR